MWQSALKLVTPYLVKIETPSGHGSGVQFSYNKPRNLVAIGTAAHVVSDADRWRLPIRIGVNAKLNEPVYIEHSERVIFTDYYRDSATILIRANLLDFPQESLPLQGKDQFRTIGSPVGWLGYPGIAPSTLCFFRGYLSAWQAERDSYLVDGVAINGVSGGPVFDSSERPTLLGVVSAYISNRQPHAVLPGLLQVQDLTAMHSAMQAVRDLDEAREKKVAEDAAKPNEETVGTKLMPEPTNPSTPTSAAR